MGDARAIVNAASKGNLDEVRRLAQQDRRLLESDYGLKTPLSAAADKGHVEVVRFLLEEGAQVNRLDPKRCTALGRACCSGHVEAVSLLLFHGADAGWGDEVPPLMIASQYGYTDVVALLLAHGCGDIDRQVDPDGCTALHFAAYHGRAGAVRALLGAGADPHVVRRVLGAGADPYGDTPLSVASGSRHAECVAELQAWECLYLLSKARRLRDAAATLSHSQAVAMTTATTSSQAPAYVASRVGRGGGALPVVEVSCGQIQAEGGQEAGGEGPLARDAVVRHVVEGLRGELFREWVGMVDVWMRGGGGAG